jgi:cation diffusion facilitator family transporter
MGSKLICRMPRKTITTKRALVTSFVVDTVDIVTNVVVALITGSAVMLAEAMQGLADLTAVSLLLVGHRRAGKTATPTHPFGFGKEAYFWALLSAVIILLFTATMSFYSGLQSFLHPEPVEFVLLAYIFLGLAMVTNGYAFSVSARKLLDGRSIVLLPQAFMRTVHIAPRTTFVLDSLGFLAAFFGFIALLLYGVTGDGRYDGIGAMIIGAMLALSSIVLLTSVKAFIIGKRASAEIEDTIKEATLSVPGVEGVLDLRTMMLGSENLLVNLEVHFHDGLVTDEIEKTIDTIKRKVGHKIPGRTYIQVEPETPSRRSQKL